MRYGIYFQKSWNKNGWEIWAFERDLNRGTRRPIKVTLEIGEPISASEVQQESSAFLREEDFHAVVRGLIDGLAEAGLLKSSGALELKLEAQKAHLEDMRTLVFQKREG